MGEVWRAGISLGYPRTHASFRGTRSVSPEPMLEHQQHGMGPGLPLRDIRDDKEVAFLNPSP